jgi:hypothetical protein
LSAFAVTLSAALVLILVTRSPVVPTPPGAVAAPQEVTAAPAPPAIVVRTTDPPAPTPRPTPSEGVLGEQQARPVATGGAPGWPSDDQADEIARALDGALTPAQVRCIAQSGLRELGWEGALAALSADEAELAQIGSRLGGACGMSASQVGALAATLRESRPR